MAVLVPVAVTVGVGVKVRVAVRMPGVGDGPKVGEVVADGIEIISVVVATGVWLAVGVGVGGSSLKVNTSQPRQ